MEPLPCDSGRGTSKMIAEAQKIDGWMSDNELLWLAKQAQVSKIILEIGSYKGRSTRALADNTTGLILCIDPWGQVEYPLPEGQFLNCDVFKIFRENLSPHIQSGRVLPLKMQSKDFEHGFKFDFIFIDGLHSYEGVKQDIEVAKRYIIPGGTIAGHDYGRHDWPGVKRAVNEVFPKAEIVDTIWHTRY